MKKPFLYLILGVFCISIFPVLVKWTPVSGISSAFYRLSIATVFLLPYAILKKNLKLPSKADSIKIIICGLLFGSDIAVWNIAIQQSSATQATFLANLSPVWIGFGSLLFFTQKPTRNFWIGAVIALTGMVILVGKEMFLNLDFNLGFLFALLSSFLYAVYIMLSKTVLNKIDTISFLSYSMSVSTIYLLIVCIVMGEPLFGFSTTVWSVLFVQGLVCQLAGWFLISYAIQNLDASKVSLSLLSQALITAVLAYLILGEDITIQMLFGGVVILLGIFITFQKKD